jgi:hypothetical protein
MRFASLSVFALMLLTSITQAADEVAPATAATPDQDAVTSTAPTTPESASTAQPTTPAEAASAASSATPAEAASSAVPEQAAKAADVPEKEPRTDEAAMDTQMKRLGFTPQVMNGEKRYCKATSVLGSRLNKKTVCWTTEQVRNHQESVQEVREKQGQRETFDR